MDVRGDNQDGFVPYLHLENEMNDIEKTIARRLQSLSQDYQNNRVHDADLKSRLKEIESLLSAKEQVYGKQQICSSCQQPMYKHHIC